MIQRINVWCIDYELLALQRSHLIIITEQPPVKLSLLPVLLEVLPPAAGLGRWPVRRHPAALGAPVLVAGHLAHLYQDAVETGRRATAATSVVIKQKYFIHQLGHICGSGGVFKYSCFYSWVEIICAKFLPKQPKLTWISNFIQLWHI